MSSFLLSRTLYRLNTGEKKVNQKRPSSDLTCPSAQIPFDKFEGNSLTTPRFLLLSSVCYAKCQPNISPWTVSVFNGKTQIKPSIKCVPSHWAMIKFEYRGFNYQKAIDRPLNFNMNMIIDIACSVSYRNLLMQHMHAQVGISLFQTALQLVMSRALVSRRSDSCQHISSCLAISSVHDTNTV